MVLSMRTLSFASALLAGSIVLAPAAAQGQGAAPAATAAPPAEGGAAPAPDGEGAKKEPPPSVTGGYSWSDKPRKRRAAKKRRTIDPNAPVATYPGFLMLPDGTSQVWVYVNKKVPVQVSTAQGRTTFTLTGTEVAVWNNTHPLVTQFFPTPLARAQLSPGSAGAQLLLDLRESVQPTHQLVDGPRGTMILRISLPKAKRDWGLPAATGRDGSSGKTLPPK